MANYMTILLMSTGATMQKMNDYLTQNETADNITAELDKWMKWDEELKLILSSNNMDIEELFLATAVPCDRRLLHCYIASELQYDCCGLVRG